MEHLGKLSIGFFSKNTSGSIQKIMDENIEKLEGIIAHMMLMALTVLLSVVAAFMFQYMIFRTEKAKGRYAGYMKASMNITGIFS